MTVLLGAAGTTLVPQPAEPACGSPRAIATANFNPDEDVYGDFAVACADGTVELLASPPTTLGTGVVPGGLAAADLNGDDIADLVMTAVNDARVLVYRGRGDLSFRKPQRYRVGKKPMGLEVADLDRDGRLDVAVANSKDDDVSVLFGAGGGRLTGRTDVKAGKKPVDMTIGRYKGKRKLPDLLTANVSRTPVAESFADDSLSLIENAEIARSEGRQLKDPLKRWTSTQGTWTTTDRRPQVAYYYSGRIATIGYGGPRFIAGRPESLRRIGHRPRRSRRQRGRRASNTDTPNAKVNVYP